MQSLTRSLQEKELDVRFALANVSVVNNSLQVFMNKLIANIVYGFRKPNVLLRNWMWQWKSLGHVSRPTNRTNTPSDTVEEYFKKVISLPFLDHLLQEMETRFTQTCNASFDVGSIRSQIKKYRRFVYLLLKWYSITTLFKFWKQLVVYEVVKDRWQAWHSNKYH